MPDKVRRPRKELYLAAEQLERVGLTVAGSYRREKDTVGDLDLLVPPQMPLIEAQHYCTTFFGYAEIQGGLLKTAGLATFNGQPLLLNLWQVPGPETWAGMLLFATGPHDLNIMMRAKAKGQGKKLSQYGLFAPGEEGEDDVQLDSGEREEEIFQLLGLEYITPVEREVWRNYLLPKNEPSYSTVEVLSSNGVDTYTVTLKDGKGWDCTCPGFAYRHKCRHLEEATK
jgi:DNA polymerase/3'-5' exonuclease PolX